MPPLVLVQSDQNWSLKSDPIEAHQVTTIDQPIVERKRPVNLIRQTSTELVRPPRFRLDARNAPWRQAIFT
jgi:hypothetical protein